MITIIIIIIPASVSWDFFSQLFLLLFLLLFLVICVSFQYCPVAQCVIWSRRCSLDLFDFLPLSQPQRLLYQGDIAFTNDLIGKQFHNYQCLSYLPLWLVWMLLRVCVIMVSVCEAICFSETVNEYFNRFELYTFRLASVIVT